MLLVDNAFILRAARPFVPHACVGQRSESSRLSPGVVLLGLSLCIVTKGRASASFDLSTTSCSQIQVIMRMTFHRHLWRFLGWSAFWREVVLLDRWVISGGRSVLPPAHVARAQRSHSTVYRLGRI